MIPWFALIVTLGVAGCTALPAVTQRIGDRTVEYALARRDSQVVVFEDGLGGTLTWWAKVFPSIASEASAFAYNRPGYGRSTSSAAPRDGTHIVEELRALLRDRGLGPPYVLVGHSLGGLYMQLFARRHPGEVAGLVLVDSTHPEQFLGSGAPENLPGWFKLVFNISLSEASRAEFAAIGATGRELLALPPITGKSVVIMIPDEAVDQSSALTIDVDRKRKDMQRLNSGAMMMRVPGGHAIPLENPEAVVAAIRKVLPAGAPPKSP